MSKPTRCPVCHHRRGLRRPGRMAIIDAKKGEQPRTKKAPCSHECHQREEVA